MPLASRRTLVYITLQWVKPPSWKSGGGNRGGTHGPSGTPPPYCAAAVATARLASRIALSRRARGVTPAPGDQQPRPA